MNIDQKIAANTIYQLIGKASTMTITIIATMLITRIYGRASYGEFSIMQGWPALFFIIVDFGINAIATRDLSKDFSQAGKYFVNILFIRLFLSGLFVVLLYFLLNLFPYNDNLRFGIKLSLLLILTQSFFTTANIIFQTKLRYDFSVISLLSGYIFILLLVLIISFTKGNIIWISFSYVVGGFITFLICLYFIKKLNIKIKLEIDIKLINFLIIQSLPLGVMFIFSQLNFKEDEILLSLLKLPHRYNLNNSETVGLYSLPYKIFEVALVMPTFFMNATYPVLIRLYEENKKNFFIKFKKIALLLFVSSLIFGFIGYFLSPLAIKILGGRDFSYSIVILRILLGGLIFYYLTQPLSYFLVIMEKQKYLPRIYLTAAIINFLLNIILIPKYSFYAAAVNTHLCEIIIFLLLLFTVLKSWKKVNA